MRYHPRNSERNRKSGLVNSTVLLLRQHNGLSYFKVEGGEPVYAFCSDALFQKEFQLQAEADPGNEAGMEPASFRKYPFAP